MFQLNFFGKVVWLIMFSVSTFCFAICHCSACLVGVDVVVYVYKIRVKLTCYPQTVILFFDVLVVWLALHAKVPCLD